MSVSNKMAETTIHYPSCYNQFNCTGSSCEFTCCSGWNIAVDREAMESYGKVKGSFGRRLKSSIDKNGVFVQKKDRCQFLNPQNLCEIYIRLGKEMMCRTCRIYPRHVEVYGFLHEVSLSLSCPEAAGRILGNPGPDVFLSKKKPEGREAGGCELDSRERRLLTELLRIRSGMFSIMKKRELPISLRMAMVLSLGHDAQRRVDTGRPMAELVERYRNDKSEERFAARLSDFLPPQHSQRTKKRQDLMCLYLELCGRLHPIVSDWNQRMNQSAVQLYGKDVKAEQYEAWQKKVESAAEFYPLYMEHLMNYFLYVYVPGAVYDGDLYSKVKLAVFSCLIIREMNITTCAQSGCITQRDAVENAYLYARELEHSDENIGMLERMMSGRAALGLKELLLCI